MFLKTLGDQLNRVEEIVETQDHIKTPFVKKDTKPLFKPFEFSKKIQQNPYVNQDLIQRISKKVKDSLIIPETPQPSHRRINVIDEEISSKQTLGDQLNWVEEIVETQDHIKTPFVEKYTKPLFKPFEFFKKIQQNPYVNQD